MYSPLGCLHKRLVNFVANLMAPCLFGDNRRRANPHEGIENYIA